MTGYLVIFGVFLYIVLFALSATAENLFLGGVKKMKVGMVHTGEQFPEEGRNVIAKEFDCESTDPVSGETGFYPGRYQVGCVDLGVFEGGNGEGFITWDAKAFKKNVKEWAYIE